MGIWKKGFLFTTGGFSYVGLELLWRGRSHGSMFLAGGSCFLLLGVLGKRRISAFSRALAGAGIITAVEYVTGLVANRSYQVWDYRNLPLNLQGQICLPYTVLWAPLSLGAMGIYNKLDQKLKQL